MKTVALTIFDETLRDGEQQVGIFFEPAVKSTLTNLIVQTGVRHVALMPAVHSTEAELVQHLVNQGHGKAIAASTMMGKNYIDQSKSCGVQTIILFNAVSDRLLVSRDPQVNNCTTEALEFAQVNQIRQRMLDRVLTHLKYAADQGLKICFAAEDASRADFDFLVECITKFSPYVADFLLCDTVGILSPEDTKLWMRNLIDFTGNKIPLSVHFHNDRGLALENTIQAVLAGATGISGTFGGIGERAGNVAIEQVLNGLKLRYNWQVEGIDYDAVNQVTDYLEHQGFTANRPYSAASLRYETGIHVDSLLRDPDSYYLFSQGQPEIWFGKFSGASNFKYLCEQLLHQPQTLAKYQEFRTIIKDLSVQEKRSFSAVEVIEILGLG